MSMVFRIGDIYSFRAGHGGRCSYASYSCCWPHCYRSSFSDFWHQCQRFVSIFDDQIIYRCAIRAQSVVIDWWCRCDCRGHHISRSSITHLMQFAMLLRCRSVANCSSEMTQGFLMTTVAQVLGLKAVRFPIILCRGVLFKA